MNKQSLKYGEYANLSDKKLLNQRKKIFETVDGYLLERHKKAKTLERIQIRGVQRAMIELCEVERELTLREDR